MGYCWSVGEDRDHTIYRFTDEIYKIVQFYNPRLRLGPGPKNGQKHSEVKLASSLSRSRRVILEKALCNEWDWFCTLTISPEKVDDRADLSGWWKRCSQWFRDLRKQGKNIRYLFVPEEHKNGAWHAHGFLAGLSDEDLISFRELDASGFRTANGRRLPRKIIKAGFYNWPAYSEKFGFCSLGKIKDPVACGFYITKYITKEQDSMVKVLGLNSYYGSHNLNVATKHLDFFGRDPFIEKILVNNYEFCRTGMTHVRHGLDWSFGFDLLDPMDVKPLDLSGSDDILSPAQEEAELFYSMDQMSIFDPGCH